MPGSRARKAQAAIDEIALDRPALDRRQLLHLAEDSADRTEAIAQINQPLALFSCRE
jgi:hypothetical protein